MRILVVDDSAIRGFLTELLNLSKVNNSPLEAKAAPSGEEAIKMLADGQHFDVVISDIEMSGMNGLELARKIRYDFPEVPLIFLMSGNPTYLSDKWEVKALADHFLLKPFRLEYLLSLLAFFIS